MIKNIIFDAGNVILDQKTVSADFYFAKVLNTSYVETKNFYKNYKKQAVAGLISFYKLTNLFKKNFKSSKSTEEIIKEYQKLYIKDVYGVNKELIDLIGQLRNKYDLYIMTNTLEPHYEYWKTFGLENYFKRMFRSDTDHFMKPERQSYEYVLKKINANPEECVFIDDLEENVNSAIKVGMKGIVYTNKKRLEIDLHKIRIFV